MFCSKCGNHMGEGAKFCPACGTPAAAPGIEIKQEKAVNYIQAQPAVLPAAPQRQQAPMYQQLVAQGAMISINNVESGPYSRGQLETMIKNGQITLAHWVSAGSSGNWVRITDVPELKAFFDRPVQPESMPPVQSAAQPERKLRHGFTTFYLWAGRILFWCGFVLVLLDICTDYKPINDMLPVPTPFYVWTVRISVLLLTWAFELIFDWKRSGFYLFVFVNAAYVFINPQRELLPTLIAGAVAIGLQYGVLHFHNAYNAKSTWEQLI